MAASSDTQLDITTCSICFETFKVRKYLPCLHNFCQGCLQTYITSAFRNDSDAKGIKCPVCRNFVCMPDSSNVDSWAAEFPGNHLLVSIIDMNISKEENRKCNACLRENKTEAAQSWCVNCSEALCETCNHYHRKLKLGVLHKVIPVEKMGTSDSPLQGADLYCSDHPERKLKAYCSDHSAACCMSCVMLKHRKCENVGNLEDVAKSKKSSEELKKLEKSFRDMKIKFQDLVDSRVKNKDEFEKRVASIKTEVNALIDRIIRHLESLRQETLQEINAAEKEILPSIDQEKDELQCKLSAIDNDLQLLQTNMKYAAPAQFLQALTKLSEQSVIMKEFLMKTKEKLQNINISFVAYARIEQIVKTIKTCGDVSVKRLSIVDCNSESDSSYGIYMMSTTPTLIKDIDAGAYIQGIAFLDDKHFLVSNNDPFSLELWDSNCSVLSSLSLPGQPFGVKMINSTEGAVALWNKALLSFKVCDNVIMEMETINVSVSRDFTFHKRCYYIGSKQKIIVNDGSHWHVHDIAIDENVYFIAARDDDTLLYTLDGGKTLQCIKLDGPPVFQYSHHKLQGTTGVTVDCFGNIYVCGYESKNVHQLSHDRKLKRVMFDGLPTKPYGIGFNKTGDKAVVVGYTRVVVYKMS